METAEMRTSIETRFACFWAKYPKKRDKGHARKAFYRLAVTDELLATVLKALEWQVHSDDWTREGGRFIPHPATYLNGERWEDELTVGISRQETVFRCTECGRARYERDIVYVKGIGPRCKEKCR